MIDVQVKQKNVFVVLLAALQKRIGEHLTPSLVLQRCIYLMTKATKQEIFGLDKKVSELFKKNLEFKLKLMCLMTLVDKYSLVAPLKEKPVAKQPVVEDSSSSEEEDSGFTSDDENSDEEVTESAPTSGKRQREPDQGHTTYSDKLSKQICSPFISVHKLVPLYWSLCHTFESLRVFRNLDYLSHLVLLKCQNAQIKFPESTIRISKLESRPIGQMLF
jgi:hypothetical protein